MTQHPHVEPPAHGLHLHWSWCAVCQRTYVTGTCRIVRFTPDGLHPHPAVLKLCPYGDCGGSTNRNGWLWSSIRLQHPEYPATPEWNVIYVRSA
jgi:hypothetical protein